MKNLKITGSVWVIADAGGHPIDNIDTDMIFHNSQLHITDVDKMGQHAFDNLDDWKEFPQQCREGDILLVGKNFGCGSSRQQAVDCFRALGAAAIVAESFGAIYRRNAINSGLAILEAPGIFDSPFKVGTGDEIVVDLERGEISGPGGSFTARPMSEIQKNIYHAGNLFAYGKTLSGG